MKVLLNQDVERLGRMGQVVEVAGGYARNYLIPRGIAVGVTRGRVKDIQEQQRVLAVKAERMRQGRVELAEKIKAQPIAIKARCSASGKLFGSITNRQLAAEIEAATGQELDRHKITIDDKIRTVGRYHALVKLHPDVEVDLEFEVEGEGFEPEEPEEEVAEGGMPGEAEAPEVEAAPVDEAGEAPDAGEATAEAEAADAGSEPSEA